MHMYESVRRQTIPGEVHCNVETGCALMRCLRLDNANDRRTTDVVRVLKGIHPSKSRILTFTEYGDMQP